MTRYRTHLPIFFLLYLSVNVFSQFDYDSIALDIGYKLQENFDFNEIELFDEKFNEEVFASYVQLENETNNKKVDEFNKQIIAEKYGNLLFKRIQEVNNETSHYHFVNYHIDELKNIYIIFRLFIEDGGINYHQFLFEPSGIAKYTLTDVYFFLGGEYFSESLQEVFYGFLSESMTDEGNFDSNSEKFKMLLKIGKIRNHLRDGKIEKARKIFYEDFTEEQRNLKSLCFLELELIDIENKAAYNELIGRLSAFGREGDPSTYLNTIDFHYLNKDYPKVLEAIDSLYSFTGDEFLSIYKANCYMELNETKKAEEHYKLASEYNPTLGPSYDYLLNFYELTDDKEKYLNTIDTMSKYLQIDFPRMSSLLTEDNPDLVNSIEYQNWFTKKNETYNQELDSLNNLLTANWAFDHMEDFDGNEIPTSDFWIEGYGKGRPSFDFNGNNTFTSTINGDNYHSGNWKFDIAYKTIDFEVEFDKRSNYGKEIIKNGAYRKEDKKYFELYSLYYYEIKADILKLFDPTDGIIVLRKQE